ncbi:MAG: alpha/beta hydrolase family protein [Planctomycetia bacterium]|nr:alpha/beta hydrolase family protein [Planctomycetia bacterium]
MRSDFREKLLDCLGGPWPDAGPLNASTIETTQHDGYRLEKVRYEVEPGESVAAYVLVPEGATSSKPAPGICLWHQHNGAYDIGMTEPAGLKGSEMHHTGVALAREGYVVVCPDTLGFGERQTGKLKGAQLERFLFLRYVVGGKCLAWKNILDMRRAVDYLACRPEVQADRLGCYGHSMGSTHTWLVGPWEPRLKVLVGNCCLPTYAAIHRVEMLHCFPNFIPGLFEFGDTPDIAALIAPRALHLNLGELDFGTPIAEAKQGIETIRRAYEAVHAEDKFTSYIEAGTGHVLSPEMWRRTKATFAKHLHG